GAFARAGVYSFTRLAWFIMNETGKSERHHVDEIGALLLLKQVVQQHKDKLVYFRKSVNQNGFYQKLEQALTELTRYGQTAESLAAYVNDYGAEMDERLLQKMQDVILILGALKEKMGNLYVKSEDYLTLLMSQLPQYAQIADTIVYIDGYHHFTEQELTLITTIAKHVKHVYVSISADRPVEGESKIGNFEVDRTPKETIQALKKRFQMENVDITEPVVFTENRRVAGNEELSFFHKELFSGSNRSYDAPTSSVISIVADDRRSEIEAVGREIFQLVYAHKLRYRDITIAVRNSGDYEDIIRQTFQQMEIPLYTDQKEHIHDHPLTEAIGSFLEVVNLHWRLESVVTLMRTRLATDATWTDIDRFENLLLKEGKSGPRAWRTNKRWLYGRNIVKGEVINQTDAEKETEKFMDEWREKIATPIRHAEARIQEAISVNDYIRILYDYLQESEILRRLEQRVQVFYETNALERARQDEHVYRSIMNMFEQFVHFLGEELMDWRSFSELITLGLDALTFQSIPSTLDLVRVTDFDLGRLYDARVVFVIGMNEGVIPLVPSEGGIILEEEREWLQQHGLTLGPTSKTKLYDERLQISAMLLQASERLYVSYPKVTNDGKALYPSNVIGRIQKLFPSLTVVEGKKRMEEVKGDQFLAWITNANGYNRYRLTQLIASGTLEEERFIDWWTVYNDFLRTKDVSFLRILEGLTYDNVSEMLQTPI
ncbi:MAG: PD-(D/E)XK nuclease family protein, partial [Bacilli bacterium]